MTHLVFEDPNRHNQDKSLCADAVFEDFLRVKDACEENFASILLRKVEAESFRQPGDTGPYLDQGIS